MRLQGAFGPATGTGAGSGYIGGTAEIIGWVPSKVAETSGGRQNPRSGGQAPETNPLIDFDIQTIKVGDAIPVVFCRRVNNIGGVMVRPAATFLAIENSSETITTKFHCVVSDGQLGPIPVKHVRRGGCRSDFEFSQNYNTRAGTWQPGNFAVPQENYEISEFPTATGGGGWYTKLTTIEFRHTQPYYYNWKAGYNVFIENGIYVNRIIDNVYGPSNNIVDLILWARQQTKKIPSLLNDLPTLKHAALFVENAGLFCNGEFKNSQSLLEFIVTILPHFLLRATKVNGKFSLRPLLPTNADGTINTGTIYPDHCFTEDVIVSGSYKETGAETSTITPPLLSMLWRQQNTDNDFPLIRSDLVADGSVAMDDIEDPPEQIDLSVFCTSELHMARVGAYIHAKRTLCRRTATVRLVAGSHTGRIREGDIVQIKHKITHSDSEEFYLNAWWEVLTISEDEALSLIEFPVDQCGKSLVALAVANVSTSGVIYVPPQPASCDLPGKATDSSIPSQSTIDAPSTRITQPVSPAPPSNGGPNIPLPSRPKADPPTSTPTPPSTPGGPPSDPNSPPTPPIPPGDSPCEEGYGEIIVNIHSGDFAGGGWGPKMDTVRTTDGVRITYDQSTPGTTINWIYNVEFTNAVTKQREKWLVTASEDGTGGANANDGRYPVWAITENLDCTSTTLVDNINDYT